MRTWRNAINGVVGACLKDFDTFREALRICAVAVAVF